MAEGVGRAPAAPTAQSLPPGTASVPRAAHTQQPVCKSDLHRLSLPLHNRLIIIRRGLCDDKENNTGPNKHVIILSINIYIHALAGWNCSTGDVQSLIGFSEDPI